MAKSSTKKSSGVKAKKPAPGRKAAPAKKPAASRKVVGKPKQAPKRTTKGRETSVKPAKPSNGSASKAASKAPPATASQAATAQTKRSGGKNEAGLTTKDLQYFRDLLVAKRRELLGDVHSMENEALLGGPSSNLSNLPDHMADQGTDNYEQEFTLGLMEKDRQLLREIDMALAKIQNGTYGICEGTGKAISRARLEAQPWARYSIEHARKMETQFRR